MLAFAEYVRASCFAEANVLKTSTGAQTYMSLVRGGRGGGLKLARKIMSDRGTFALLRKETAKYEH